LTDKHESARAAPWAVQDAPREWVERIMQAIVGIEIPLQRMQGKWKVSQNRSPADQRRIAEDTGIAMLSA
jgi:transcriptional regulator